MNNPIHAIAARTMAGIEEECSSRLAAIAVPKLLPRLWAGLILTSCLLSTTLFSEEPVLTLGKVQFSYYPSPFNPPWREQCELGWESRRDTQYQLMRSGDLVSWAPVNDAYLGNGLPIKHVQNTYVSNTAMGYFRLEYQPLAIPVIGDYVVMSDTARILREVSGSGVPLVLVHGGRSSAARSWNRQLLHFSPSCRVMRYDTRMFGRSDKFGESPWYFNWDHTNRVTVDLLELIDGFANEPVILCGLSMGSAIAAQFATLHPDKVRKLVLVSAWGGKTFPRDPAQMQLLESLSPRTLMIAGGSDTQSLIEFSYASQNGYTAGLFVIDGAGHYVNETHPDAFNAALSQFISAE